MGLAQEKNRKTGDPTNRYVLTIRLNYTVDKQIIDRLSTLESDAMRGYICDAISAYINDGEPMPRNYAIQEQALMIKKVVEDSFRKILDSGKYLTISNNNGMDRSSSENKYDEIISDISDEFLNNLTL